MSIVLSVTTHTPLQAARSCIVTCYRRPSDPKFAEPLYHWPCCLWHKVKFTWQSIACTCTCARQWWFDICLYTGWKPCTCFVRHIDILECQVRTLYCLKSCHRDYPESDPYNDPLCIFPHSIWWSHRCPQTWTNGIIILIYTSLTGRITWEINRTNPTMHLSHIPLYTILNRHLHISVLNSVFWDMGQVHCGIWEVGLLFLVALDSNSKTCVVNHLHI